MTKIAAILDMYRNFLSRGQDSGPMPTSADAAQGRGKNGTLPPAIIDSEVDNSECHESALSLKAGQHLFRAAPAGRPPGCKLSLLRLRQGTKYHLWVMTCGLRLHFFSMHSPISIVTTFPNLSVTR